MILDLPSHVQLVAASKTQSLSRILSVYDTGVTHFAENRVEEAVDKIHQLPTAIRQQTTWHLIGHLQSRKVKQAVELFDWIQSVDSLELAQKISTAATAINKKINILLQVNISGEKTKSGFILKQDADFANTVRQISQLPAINLKGLMTIAPQVDDPKKAQPYFASLKKLQLQLQTDLKIDLPELSMGMSEDYQAAIAAGATMVRLGRAVFGERKNA